MSKSTSFFEQRQSRVEARLDRFWQPVLASPVLAGGNIHYEVSGRSQAVGCGGLGMLQVIIETTGLQQAIDEKVQVLKRHKPYQESDHVLSLALNILTGGQCLEDLELRRRDEAFLDALGARRLPDPTTAGDFLRRFDVKQVGNLMEATLRASANVWRGRPESERRLAVIDVDGTLVDTFGECKEKMEISYKGRWGFGPLLVSLANTQEVLWVVNRPANRPSHDGATPWMDKAIVWAKEQAGFSKVRLRGDTDFSLTANFDRWTDQEVEFVFGMDANPGFVRRARALPEEAWKPLERTVRPVKRQRKENVKQQVIEQRGFKHLRLAAEDVAEG